MTLYGQDLDVGWAKLRTSLEELLDYAADKEVRLLIEPAHRYETTLILTVEDGLRMIDEIGSDRLGILLDTGHANVNGEDLAAVAHKLSGIPLHINIDDNHGDSDAHLVPGEGSIDFRPFVQALEEIGYDGFVSAELGFQYTGDPDPAVKQTRAGLTRIFG